MSIPDSFSHATANIFIAVANTIKLVAAFINEAVFLDINLETLMSIWVKAAIPIIPLNKS